MALTNCLECKGQVSTTATHCPHCGRATGNAWGACPECGGAITPTQEICKECGFPLKPRPKPAESQPARIEKNTTGRRRKRRKSGFFLEAGEEPPAAMTFAVFGLLVPLFAFIGLALSKRGSRAYLLSWIGIALWIAGTLFLVSRIRGSA